MSNLPIFKPFMSKQKAINKKLILSILYHLLIPLLYKIRMSACEQQCVNLLTSPLEVEPNITENESTQ